MSEINNCIVPLENRENLEKLHTKQLLKKRFSSNIRFYEEYSCEFCENRKLCEERSRENERMLYSILNTREHIPNKIESKMIRKRRKKQGK